MIKRGDVIQCTESAGEWCGCLMIVEEVKSFGCMASMKVPFKGTAYMRLNSDQYEKIGTAVLVSHEEEDEVEE